jgi:hypothetical protein
VDGLARAAKSIFVPNDVYAIDIGGGGFAEFFSTFGVVDPQSKQDLAQSTTSYFAPLMTTLVVGDQLPLQSWSVTNLGSGTSGAFTSEIVIASDSLLTTQVLPSTPIGGAPSLVPGASFPYAARSVAMPTAPGTYYVGTRIIYSATDNDSTAADDWKSFRVVVNAAPSSATYSLNPATTYNTANAGGGGGGEYTIPCSTGDVGVGMIGTVGTFGDNVPNVNTAGIICAPLLANGSLGTPYQTGYAGSNNYWLWGGFPGTPFTGNMCGGGSVLIGGEGTTYGAYVSGLSGSCASLSTVALNGARESVIGPWNGTGAAVTTPWARPCNPGEVVTGLHGRSGWIVDAIGFQCTQLVSPAPVVIP